VSSPKVRAVILAVDDESDALAILQWSLAREGFEVMTASSSLEAMRHIQHHQPDLVITDYQMPAMTGLALCRWLRGQRETRGIPIILHTGQTLPSTDPLYDRLITKPSEIDALLSEVHALLELSRFGRADTPPG